MGTTCLGWSASLTARFFPFSLPWSQKPFSTVARPIAVCIAWSVTSRCGRACSRGWRTSPRRDWRGWSSLSVPREAQRWRQKLKKAATAVTCKSLFSRFFLFWNFTSRSQGIFISLFILDLNVFSFHFSFSKRVKGKQNSLFISRKEWKHFRFHSFSQEKMSYHTFIRYHIFTRYHILCGSISIAT